ncbi:type II secretion system protein [Desulfonatronum sp. SC1]|uniref:type II secretion system protein n=1 Tax=Desulfonatronum sp. SC1 TaxID=2109626 RepID=UPI001304C5B9|nr:type II secretion system protein [Desulfonatronum sp. SC1]
MKAENGFSLLELLVVMLIISVSLGIFLGYNYTQRDTVMLRSTVSEARQFLRMAQGFALLEGRDNECVYQPQEHLLRETLRGRELTLPEIVRVSAEDLQPLGDAHLRVTAFYADGSSLGGRLKLAAADREMVIRMDPILGETYLEEDEN